MLTFVYEIDILVAGMMLIRRDVTVEDWSDPVEGQHGVRATTRFGLGILRSNAIAKMTNIRTTLQISIVIVESGCLT